MTATRSTTISPLSRVLSNSLFACGLALLLASTAVAQVRTAPDGNSLPEEPLDPHAQLKVDPTPAAAPRAKLTPQQHQAFAQKLDLDAFRKLAVFDGGRVKIIDTLAREQVNDIYGKPRFRDPHNEFRYDPVFTYLDLVFNRSYYHDKPVVYIEVLDLRRAIVNATVEPGKQDDWLRLGRVTPIMLADPRAAEIVSGMDRDLNLAKALRQVRIAAGTFETVASTMNMVSPPPGSDQWAHVMEVRDTRVTAAQAVPGMLPSAASVTDAQAAAAVQTAVGELRDAWHAADAPAVNAALRTLVDQVPRLNPATYPPTWKLDAERLYNMTRKFTIGYVAYFLATIALLIAFGVQRRWLITSGIVLLLLGFAVHAAGIGVRAAISGRWPIHNQYESYIAITWFAAMIGIGLMLLNRQWLYGAAAAALGCLSLLLANTVDIPSHEMGQVAGILATSRILYVHVNMVLFSYGLITLGFFVSLFYLGVYYFGSRTAVQYVAAGLNPQLATAGGAAPASDAVTPQSTIDDDNAPVPPGYARLLHDLDRAQMVVLQLAFWILIVGIGLGAYWADHAWGRWWAWDPKETWALITWIIYLIVIHVRFAVARRGLVTAWLSVAGFFIMLWTYWGVNLLLAGLHSYA